MSLNAVMTRSPMTASTASRGSVVKECASIADSASGRSGTSTSARNPSLPRFTPSTGNCCRSASRMARSTVPSPPMLTSRSARCRSSSAVTGLALQASLDSSLSMPSTSIPRWSAQSSTEATAPPQSRSGCSISPTTCMPSRYSGTPGKSLPSRARLGPVEYSHVVLQVADQPDQTLVTYSPAQADNSSPPRVRPGRIEHATEPDWRAEDGARLPMVLWHPGPGYRMISSGVLGGGLGPREWVLNAQVPAAYARTDPAEHLRELARGLDLTGPGVGLLTAAQVTDLVQRQDEEVQAAATVGLRVPTWAAAPPGRPRSRTGARHHQRHRRPAGAADRRGVRQRGRHRHRGQGPGRPGRRVRRHRDRQRRHLRRRADRSRAGRGVHRAAFGLGGPDRPGRAHRRPRRGGPATPPWSARRTQ